MTSLAFENVFNVELARSDDNPIHKVTLIEKRAFVGHSMVFADLLQKAVQFLAVHNHFYFVVHLHAP